MAEAPRPAVPSVDGLKRIIRATQIVERGNRNGAAPRGRYLGDPDPGLRHAQTTSTITARSGSTIGSGSANLYHLVGSTLTADSPTSAITAKNSFGTSVASGKWVIVAFISGEWFLVAADC